MYWLFQWHTAYIRSGPKKSYPCLPRDATQSAVSRAYNGGLGAEPPAGSRGSAPGQGVRGRSPPEAESFFAFGRAINAV